MRWEDRITEARYTSPSGKEMTFGWDSKLSRETALKTGVFTFPDRDGAHVQHQGTGVRTFPMVCIFSGSDCMDEADVFETLMFERGVAELQHPIYGVLKVIPTGSIKREDELVSALNESTVTVTFTETITDENGSATALAPTSAAEIERKFESFADSAAADFAENIVTENVSEELQLQSMQEAQLEILSESLTPVVDTAVSESYPIADSSGASSGSSSGSGGGNTGGSGGGTGGSSGGGGTGGSGGSSSGGGSASGGSGSSSAAGNSPSAQAQQRADQRKNKQAQADFETAKKEYKTSVRNYKDISGGDITAGIPDKPVSGFDLIDSLKKFEKRLQARIDMARLVLKIIKTPSRMIVNLLKKIEGYTGLIMGLVNQFRNDPYGINNVKNAFTSTRLVLASALASLASGSAITVIGIALGSTAGNRNITREDAVRVAVILSELFEIIKQFEDSKIESIPARYNDTRAVEGLIDVNASAYLTLNEIVYSSIQTILNASLSLSMRRTITLDRDRQAIELCAELYGSPVLLDQFIMDNDLNIDELEIIPMGREVTYYV